MKKVMLTDNAKVGFFEFGDLSVQVSNKKAEEDMIKCVQTEPRVFSPTDHLGRKPQYVYKMWKVYLKSPVYLICQDDRVDRDTEVVIAVWSEDHYAKIVADGKPYPEFGNKIRIADALKNKKEEKEDEVKGSDFVDGFEEAVKGLEKTTEQITEIVTAFAEGHTSHRSPESVPGPGEEFLVMVQESTNKWASTFHETAEGAKKAAEAAAEDRRKFVIYKTMKAKVKVSIDFD